LVRSETWGSAGTLERHFADHGADFKKAALDEKMCRKGGKGINQTFVRLRLIVLTALTTRMRIAEVFSLRWRDLNYREELIAVRAKLKGGKVRLGRKNALLPKNGREHPELRCQFRYVPMPPGAKRDRQRVDRSFETILELAGIKEFRFHDLWHTFASWHMMNGGNRTNWPRSSATPISRCPGRLRRPRATGFY
jgi:integrase